MKEYVYSLKSELDSGEKNPFKGEVKLKLLNFVERNKVARDLNFKVDAGQNIEHASLYDLNDKMCALVKENVVSMHITKDGTKFTDFEELDYDNDVAHLYGELGGILLNGVNLGNGSKKK